MVLQAPAAVPRSPPGRTHSSASLEGTAHLLLSRPSETPRLSQPLLPTESRGPRVIVGLEPARSFWLQADAFRGQENAFIYASAPKTSSSLRFSASHTWSSSPHSARFCSSSLFQPLLFTPTAPTAPQCRYLTCQAEVGKWPQLEDTWRACHATFYCWVEALLLFPPQPPWTWSVSFHLISPPALFSELRAQNMQSSKQLAVGISDQPLVPGIQGFRFWAHLPNIAGSWVPLHPLIRQGSPDKSSALEGWGRGGSQAQAHRRRVSAVLSTRPSVGLHRPPTLGRGLLHSAHLSKRSSSRNTPRPPG
ncbi:uncharacterized protein LOC123327571 [Bubalus bubalis]|uniref:uncharacterized protein LOC123327571 n=1 Tax=Bubalus bubalis TaxID=89462 RepID=UPI001D10C54F|nr:uncharacterized protein LOC123327571 [Bubalus bubalis]